MNSDNPMSEAQAKALTDIMTSRKKVPAATPPPSVPAPPPEVSITAEEAFDGVAIRKQKAKRGQSHKELFVQEVGMTARYGKAVYIRKEFHERIQKIVQIVGANEVTLYSYIDNVLAHHFSTYQEEITKEYDASIKGIF